MTMRRTTSNKRDRERIKQARAAAKRDGRAARSAQHDHAAQLPDDGVGDLYGSSNVRCSTTSRL